MNKWVYAMMAMLVAMMFSAQAQVYEAAKVKAVVENPITLPTNNLLGFDILDLAVQNHDDVVIRVMGAAMDTTSTTKLPVVAGSEVVVFFSDRFELIGAPQCHWNGTGEQTRYSYTLTMKEINPKYPQKDRVTSFSINLLDFAAKYTTGEGEVQVTQMGVNPKLGTVTFIAVPFTDNERSNIRQFAARFEK